MAIHQEISFDASAKQLFDTLTTEGEFSKATGAPATIEAKAGGEFSGFGGKVTGRFIEVEPNERIVLAWRVGMWDPGVYSIVKFDISDSGAGSTLVLDHGGYPDEMESHLESGWHQMYWDPLNAHFA